MTEEFVDVVLRLRNQLAAGLNQATSQLRKFFDSVSPGKSDSQDFFGLGAAALKATVVIQGINTAMTTVNAISHAIKGEWDEVGDTLERLPFGIGKITSEARKFWKIWTDVSAEIDKANAKWTEWQQKQQAWAAEQKAGLQESKDVARDAAAKRALLERQGIEREILKITQEFNREWERLNEIGRRGGGQDFLDKARADLIASRDLAIDEIKNKAAEEEKRKEHDRRRELLHEEEEFQEQILRMKGELAQKSLQVAGKTLEAELERIKEEYRQKRRLAVGEQQGLLDELEKAEIQLATRRDAERRKEKVKSDTSATLVSNEFRGLAAIQKEKNEQVAAVQRVEKAVRDIGKGIQDAIEMLPRMLPAGVVL